jgi:hypothetical protein
VETELEEGFLGTSDRIFLSQEYRKLQDAQKEYQNMLTSLENTIGKGNTTNVESHVEKESQVKQYLEDTESADNKLFQIKQHRQNNKMNQLETNIEKYNQTIKDLGVDDDELRSMKSQSESVNLNIKRISDLGNNPDNGKYLIFINNQCMSYENRGDVDTYSLAFCNKSNPKLHFKIKSIGDVEEYNKHVSNVDKITSDYAIGFPFSIVKPDSVNDKCVSLDQEGLSVQPCNLSDYQMWHTSSHNKACKN